MKTLIKRKMMTSSTLRWLALSVLGVCAVAYALTPADTVITNKAVVEYEDSVGNSFSSESNPAEVIVGTVYTATIEQDRLDYSGAPGQQVYLPYILTNAGNAEDIFTITVSETDFTALDGNTITLDSGDGVVYQVYRDDDGNGEPDTGATNLSGSTITVSAESSQALVVAITVPVTATASDYIGSVLTATSANTTVDDLTPSNGADTGAVDANDATTETDGEETVHGLVDVTTDAVLVLTKDSTVNTGAQTIDYTLTVKNNGGVDAANVEIYDLMPYADINGDGNFDTGVDVRLPYSAASVSDSGLLTANGDTDAVYDSTSTNLVVEAGATNGTADLNDDGDTADTISPDTAEDELIHATDASLGSNVEISVSFTVSYASLAATVPAGTLIRNSFCTVAELDASGDTTAQCSNDVIDAMPAIYGIELGDTTAADGDDHATDGDDQGSVSYATTDEDLDDNDDQHVDSAAEGQDVVFYVVVENTGNVGDTFLISVDETAASLFPDGTDFAVYDTTGTSMAADTTPVIPAGNSFVVQVVATLPLGIGDTVTVLEDGATAFDIDANGIACVTEVADDCTDVAAVPFSTTVTATSTGDSSSDTATVSVGLLTQAAPDLANVTTNNFAAVVAPGIGTNTGSGFANGTYDETDLVAAGNFQPDDAALLGDGTVEPYFVAENDYKPGDVVVFDLMVANETGQSDTFVFSTEYLGYDDGASAFAEDAGAGVLPTGWSVRYLAVDGVTPVTATSLLPSYDGSNAVNATFFYKAEVTISADAANADPGEYDFRFIVTSSATGETDSKVDSLLVIEDCQIDLTESQTDAVQAGGTVDFDHIIRNTGNVDQDIAPEALFGNSSSTENDWSVTTLIENSAGAFVPFINGVVVAIYDSATGAVKGAEPTETVAAGVFELESDEFVNIRVRIFTPATETSGTSKDITLSVSTSTGTCAPADNVDTVEVVDEQVRIFKTVAVDANCDCDQADGDFADTGSSAVSPGECAIWRLRAENQGDSDAVNVVIRDAVTEYTTLMDVGGDSAYDDGEFQDCVTESSKGGSCVYGTNFDNSDATGSTNGTIDGANISWDVGTLVSGNAAEAAFCVQIQ